MKAKKSVFGVFCLIVAFVGLKVEDHIIDTEPAIREVPTSRKVVALTFDDGPLNTSTPKILQILREKGVKATFFVVGERVEKYPMLVRQEAAEGHEVGNHTYSHPKLRGLNRQEIDKEIEKNETLISQVAPRPTLFRPPEGKYSKTVLEDARERGYIIVLWSIDTKDWRCPPVGDIVDSVLKNVKPGSIILLHDGKYPSPTPEAVDCIIDSLKSRGYEFVTVSELLQYYQPASR
ncbi:polysaccharide deacetylase [Lucifera butyrica]|uniref:Polysaccharide deacetylase n=1 Tax=Lucifera butyrica TaxID=1351585 RepID=A0A498R2K9_9FIRM|nr:polysaccharide deacetylase family protein [Lucifera butyrica]VBB05000.1 polysaccharide deacetylase [Lucifera butyrica]